MSTDLAQLQRVTERSSFSGVVRVDRPGEEPLLLASGAADRAWQAGMSPDTQLAVASGAKGFTALTVLSLVDDGTLSLDTTARSLLDADLPLIADDVTVEHLLCHRSGIGDYFPEDDELDLNDHLLPIPVHELATTADYLQVLDGHPTAFPAGERGAYNNGGFVVLALLVERATGRSFYDLVDERVCEPGGLRDTAFLRSDQLPGGVARGYLDAEGLRTNVLHLPVRGSGDGGLYTTVADVHALWTALDAGRIVSDALREALGRRRDDGGPDDEGYGLGFWIPAPGALALEGLDTGVSFRTEHRPDEMTWTVISNTADGAWPVAAALSR